MKYTQRDNHQWLNIWELIDRRNQQLGWARFDYADLDSHPLVLNCRIPLIGKMLRKLFRGMDLFAPIPFHHIVRMPKQVVPTAYYHVGIAYLLREGLKDGGAGWDPERVNRVCEEVLDRKCAAEDVCWEHPYPAHAMFWKTKETKNIPESCAHHVARVGTLLLETGKIHTRQDFIDAGGSAARALLKYHNWHTYGDGTATVSYYPSTNDETINTCTDVAALFAEIPADQRPVECQVRLEALTQMALNEQQPDGSWFYCTTRHYTWDKRPPTIDNFHTAQVIQSLARILLSGNLPASTTARVSSAIEKGLAYYLTRFYKDDGTGYYYPVLKGQLCPIVGYTEGLAAIYWALWCGAIQGSDTQKHALAFVPRMVKKSLEFLNQATGDVASAKFFGRYYHIQSLRWGSGPLMEGLMYAIRLTSSGEKEMSNANSS